MAGLYFNYISFYIFLYVYKWLYIYKFINFKYIYIFINFYIFIINIFQLYKWQAYISASGYGQMYLQTNSGHKRYDTSILLC